MPIGSSGRIVVELEPELKQSLHAALRENGTNLKDWFTEQARLFLEENDHQLPLSFEIDKRRSRKTAR